MSRTTLEDFGLPKMYRDKQYALIAPCLSRVMSRVRVMWFRVRVSLYIIYFLLL